MIKIKKDKIRKVKDKIKINEDKFSKCDNNVGT